MQKHEREALRVAQEEAARDETACVSQARQWVRRMAKELKHG